MTDAKHPEAMALPAVVPGHDGVADVDPTMANGGHAMRDHAGDTTVAPTRRAPRPLGRRRYRTG